MGRMVLGTACATMLALAAPAWSQDSLFGTDSDGDGLADGYEDANGNGTPDGFESGGPQGGAMEAECLATARPEICLAYFQFNCSYHGFALACAMAQIGNACQSGDGNACGYFQQVLQANTACYMGDQAACGWLAQQPLPRQ